MMMYPDAQSKAQAEIDRVVGRDRLPTLDDRSMLPYTEALILELMRWAPPIPISTPKLKSAALFPSEVFSLICS